MTFSYLDPAAGSGLIAVVGAGTAGAAVAWRMLRDRVRPGRATHGGDHPEPAEEPEPPSS